MPVTLAIMPLMSGVENARWLFDMAFAVVILSLLIQGTTIPGVAKILGMVLPPQPEPLSVREIWLTNDLYATLQSFRVAPKSDAEHSHPYAMTRDPRFAGSRLFSLVRNGRTQHVNIATQMQSGDVAWYVLPEEDGSNFARQFADEKSSLHEQHFFGEFVVNPGVKLGEIASVYGIDAAAEDADKNLAQLFRSRFGDVPVAGDRVDLGGVCLTVKELDAQGNIRALGLKMPKQQEG